MDLNNLRRSYQLHGFDENEALVSPFEQLRTWMREAKEATPGDWFEVNAMTLSTADTTGHVTSRIVLLKELADTGLTFFTNYHSEKAAQLAANPRASLLFYWGHLERQARIEGTISKVSEAESIQYFAKRPRGSQLGAHASSQSAPVANRQVLESALAQVTAKYADGEVPKPQGWGGYRLTPTRFEFWQGRPDRLHDRVVYRIENGNWSRARLSP